MTVDSIAIPAVLGTGFLIGAVLLIRRAFQAPHREEPVSPAYRPEPDAAGVDGSSAPPAGKGGEAPPLPPGHPTPGALYQALLDEGAIQHDADQEAVLGTLDAAAAALAQPVERIEWRRAMVWRAPGGGPTPKGLYLFGPVGRGKSMLMQLLFDSAQFPQKRRVHFHPFMKELHQRMHESTPPQGMDMMLFIASEISEEARLLCFDEFYVDNIADAMLLGRLLEALFKCGVTLCSTSNWAPEDLFQGGFNRVSFMPMLKVLRNNINVLDLAVGADWRRSGDEDEAAPRQSPEALFETFAGKSPQAGQTTLHQVILQTRGADDGVFWFDFAELCARSVGPAEFMDLTARARALIISDAPELNTEKSVDWAMRLVVLVDLLYERQTPLRLLSETPLAQLCVEGPAAFAFQRTLSRIHALARLERD